MTNSKEPSNNDLRRAMAKACTSGCTVSQLLQHTLPVLQKLHADDTITSNLTEYQRLFESKTAGRDLLRELPLEMYGEMVRICFRLACWMQYGMPVFRLTPDLFAALLLTDPTNVEPHIIRQPFPTFALLVPPSFWASEAPDGKKYDVHLAWVHTYSTLIKPTWTWSASSAAYNAALQQPHHDLTWLGAAAGPVLLHDNAQKLPTEETTNFSLSEWLNEEKETPDKFMSIERTRNDVPVQKAFRRLYVNLCLYVLEHGHGTQEKTSLLTRLKKHTRKGQQNPPLTPNVWLLGQNVKIHPELLTAARNWVEAQRGIRAGWKIRKRFVVRGHWRNQAHGSQRSLRRKQFIEPHWKGPTEGTKLQHIYTDKGKGGNGD